MSDRYVADLCPILQTLWWKFRETCQSQGISVGLSQTYRNEQDQNNDYAQGRTVAGAIITNAQYGESPHNCVLEDGTPAAKAFDFYILNDDGTTCDWNASDEKWKTAISIGQGLGLISGSTFAELVDNPHMELINWRTT